MWFFLIYFLKEIKYEILISFVLILVGKTIYKYKCIKIKIIKLKHYPKIDLTFFFYFSSFIRKETFIIWRVLSSENISITFIYLVTNINKYLLVTKSEWESKCYDINMLKFIINNNKS